MADDETGRGVLLTIQDLLDSAQAGGRLASLSACETGIVGTELPDEVVALRSALRLPRRHRVGCLHAGPDREATYDAAIVLRGCRQGQLRATETHIALSGITGRIESEVDGHLLARE